MSNRMRLDVFKERAKKAEAAALVDLDKLSSVNSTSRATYKRKRTRRRVRKRKRHGKKAQD